MSSIKLYGSVTMKVVHQRDWRQIHSVLANNLQSSLIFAFNNYLDLISLLINTNTLQKALSIFAIIDPPFAQYLRYLLH